MRPRAPLGIRIAVRLVIAAAIGGLFLLAIYAPLPVAIGLAAACVIDSAVMRRRRRLALL